MLVKNLLMLFIGLFFTINTTVSAPNIIPQPQKMILGKGAFVIDSKVVVSIFPSTNQDLRVIANQFISQFAKASRIKLTLLKDNAPKGVRIIRFEIKKGKTENEESYKLTVKENGIHISAPALNGCFYGFQTLLQLLPEAIFSQKIINDTVWKVPCISIVDEPRFKYRGFMLDVSRHFFPVSYIKRTIDLMAMHKMNVFHWHLTDDQGWRIEIKKYPNLTKVGSERKETQVGKEKGKFDGIPYGGFYTQEEIREIVAYAASKYITIIPEIEMPGHALAALSAYPDLGCTAKGYEVACQWGIFDDVYCAGKENTFRFIEDVLTEVMSLFPGKYIHIGGDECRTIHWKECPFCQNRIKKENLRNEKELQSYFVSRIEKFLISKGKSLIGWDDILEGGLAPHATVMSWRGIKGGIEAARLGHKVIMTPRTPMYFNIAQSLNTDEPLSVDGKNYIDTLYNYEPINLELTGAATKFIWGIQANLWAEHIYTTDIADHMIFPRLCALSEIQWIDGSKKDWGNFKSRLTQHLRRLDMLNVKYAKNTF